MERNPSTHGKYASGKEGRQEMYLGNNRLDHGRTGEGGSNPPGGVERAFDLKGLLARVEEEFQMATWGGQNRLQIVANPNLPATLFGDAFRLERALAHLVNSLSQCVEGATIQVSTTAEGRGANGVALTFGLDLIEGPNAVVFPEERGAEDLEAARSFARTMGGDVLGPRVEGVGSMIQFSKTFPCPRPSNGNGKPTEAEASKDPGEPMPSPRNSNRARRILLAEDNRVTQAVTRKVLQRRGHEVSVAGNGREAVDQVKERTFDVVLMDLEMPEMDGLTATQLIRALPSLGPPIVAYTAFVEEENRRQCKHAGVDEILAKPVSCDDLLQEVERWPRRIGI